MHYFLGVDIGGTKSHAVIADSTGQVLGIGEGGPGNHEMIGLQGFHDVLHGIVQRALESAEVERGQIAGAGLGIAGYDWPSDHEPHRQVIETLALNAPYQFVNDAVIGLIAGTQHGWGVSVVAGTGNNCRGRDAAGREGRVAGTSYWTGENGGGSDLIRKAVETVWHAWTKRGPETRLTQKFLDHTGARDALELIEGLSRGRFHLGAGQAPLVFEVANEGDPVALECIRWIGRELGGLATGVIRQLGFETLNFEVVLTGSLYKGSPLIEANLRETIHAVAPGAELVPLNAPPVVGGVLLGMEQVGLNDTGVRQRLIESTAQMLYQDRDRSGILYGAVEE
jgi:N-acetylglucosamine kinase-like BadF-type ATPase